MIKSTSATIPAERALGVAQGKVGEGGELVGEVAEEIFTDAIFCGKAGIPHTPSPQEW